MDYLNAIREPEVQSQIIILRHLGKTTKQKSFGIHIKKTTYILNHITLITDVEVKLN